MHFTANNGEDCARAEAFCSEAPRFYKKYVRVRAEFDPQGNIRPQEIVWEDGQVFEIDRVLDIRRCESLKAGGLGLRYAVRIEGREKYLYYEEPRWFVEARRRV